VDRDDWKWYDEDEMAEDEEEGGKKAGGDFQCPRCTHWLERGTTWCGYCGTVFQAPPAKRKE
jgi:hypothetical protein